MARSLRRLVFALALAAPALAALPVHADPAWRAEVARTTRWLGDTSAAALTTDTLTSAEMSAERHVLAIELPGGRTLDVAAVAGLGIGGVDGTTFQRLATTTSELDLTAGLHATARFLRIGVISARAAAGTTREALKIEDVNSLTLAPVDDHGWGAIATAALGAEIEPIATPSFRFGVGVEVGYTATSAIQLFTYPSDRPDPDLSIDTTYASLGHLDLDGWTLRVGMHASF
jgi:hypothetical protein